MYKVSHSCLGIGVLFCFVLLHSCIPSKDTFSDVYFSAVIDSIDIAMNKVRYDDVLAFYKQLQAYPLNQVSSRNVGLYYNMLGDLSFELADYELAIESFTSLLYLEGYNRSGRSILPYLAIAHSLKKAGDTTKAIEWYRMAEKLDEKWNLRDINNNLAALFTYTHQYDSALHRLAVSHELYQRQGVYDPTGLAWWNVMSAVCLVGKGQRGKALSHLETAVRTFEHQRDHHTYRSADVRLSIYDRIWRDSVVLRGIGTEWSSYRNRLRVLAKADSLEVASFGVPSQRAKRSRSIRNFLSPIAYATYAQAPSNLQTEMITSRVLDDRGWEWVGTLRGLCLRVGNRLLPMKTEPYADSRRPVRSIKSEQQYLLIERYTGATDSIPWKGLVPQRLSANTTSRPTVQWSWHPWIGKQPSALVSIVDTTKVVYFYGAQYGISSISRAPQNETQPRLSTGERWSGLVQCGIGIDSSKVLLGTSSGYYRLDLHTGIVVPVTVQKDNLNQSSITSMGFLSTGALRSTVALGSAVAFPNANIHTVSASEIVNENYPFQYEPALVQRLPLTNLIERSRSVEESNEITRHAPEYAVVGPRYRVWLRGPNVFVFDTMGYTIGVQTTPDSVRLTSNDPLASFASNSGFFGFIDPRGMLLGHIQKQTGKSGYTIYAYRKPGQTHYRVAANGVNISISGSVRDVEIICGRPASYGLISIPQKLRVPWLHEEQSGRTSSTTFLHAIPHGTHTISVSSDDMGSNEFVTVTVEPLVHETVWFWGIVTGMVVALVIGGSRYVSLLQQMRQVVHERARYEERTQIGQDLHDALGADIVRINMLSRGTASALSNEEITRLTLEANRKLRDIIWSVSDTRTLDAATAVITERVRELADYAGIEVAVVVPASLPTTEIDPQKLRDIILIINEALANILKHARATTIRYTVGSDEESVTMSLADNGIGYDTTRSRIGVGITSMTRRASRSQLHLHSVSSPGNGTTVTVTIPLGSA